MKDCLFCRIGEGSLPSYKIWEDDLVLAFLDIFPMGEGHTLIIPKSHSDNYLSLSPELWAHMGSVAGRIGEAHLAEGAEGTNFLRRMGRCQDRRSFIPIGTLFLVEQATEFNLVILREEKPATRNLKTGKIA